MSKGSIPSQPSYHFQKEGGQQWAIPNKPREHSFMTHRLLGRLQDYKNGEGRSHKSLKVNQAACFPSHVGKRAINHTTTKLGHYRKIDLRLAKLSCRVPNVNSMNRAVQGRCGVRPQGVCHELNRHRIVLTCQQRITLTLQALMLWCIKPFK